MYRPLKYPARPASPQRPSIARKSPLDCCARFDGEVQSRRDQAQTDAHYGRLRTVLLFYDRIEGEGVAQRRVKERDYEG
jgi:hypothetical protein